MKWSDGLTRSLQVVSLPNQTPRETPGGISVPPRRIWRRGVGTGSVLQTAVGRVVIYGPGSCACSEIKLVLGVLLLGLESGCQPSAVELGRVHPRSANPILTLCRIAQPAPGLFYPHSSPVILLSLFSRTSKTAPPRASGDALQPCWGWQRSPRRGVPAAWLGNGAGSAGMISLCQAAELLEVMRFFYCTNLQRDVLTFSPCCTENI